MIHLPQPLNIPDIIRDVVAAVAVEYGSPIQFYHENPVQFQNRLDERTKVGRIKFPCIVLFHDYPERYGKDYPQGRIPRIGIACETKPAYLSEQRYELNYLPILYPIYQLFKIMLSRSPHIVYTDPDQIPHTKMDCLYWGVIGKVTNDYLDAIEMQNTELNFIQNC